MGFRSVSRKNYISSFRHFRAILLLRVACSSYTISPRAKDVLRPVALPINPRGDNRLRIQPFSVCGDRFLDGVRPEKPHVCRLRARVDRAERSAFSAADVGGSLRRITFAGRSRPSTRIRPGPFSGAIRVDFVPVKKLVCDLQFAHV